jgi:hypothetical protein
MSLMRCLTYNVLKPCLKTLIFLKKGFHYIVWPIWLSSYVRIPVVLKLLCSFSHILAQSHVCAGVSTGDGHCLCVHVGYYEFMSVSIASQGEYFEDKTSHCAQVCNFCFHRAIPGIKLSHFVHGTMQIKTK